MAGDSKDVERTARIWHRRQMIHRGLAFATALWVVPGAYADELVKTPKQTEGPFYPDKLPLDTDNDLIVVNENTKPSVGDVTHLTGRILSPTGEPIRNALVEIWQCDANGAYLHSGTGNGAKRDSNFQGFGRFLTNSKGEYYFRTIKPVPYPGRTPHIHYKVKKGGKELLVTQCYIKGHPQNERDGVLRGIRDPKAKAALMVDWRKMEDSRLSEFAANFDIVLGKTPEA
jgi:protocatechuate 3,4-dioxygenase, beta subunit